MSAVVDSLYFRMGLGRINQISVSRDFIPSFFVLSDTFVEFN